ncbi:aminotransferase class III-fold pyridoxal phosphate-dependent enzyme, partial [Bacillus sp. SS-TM]
VLGCAVNGPGEAREADIPPAGYLKEAFEVCKKENVLFVADEIQTGLGRTGKVFACDWDNVTPDMYILGKALGGGVFPISCVAANRDILGVFEPGSHGSTFGGNPLACAVSIAALEVLEEEKLTERSLLIAQLIFHLIEEK